MRLPRGSLRVFSSPSLCLVSGLLTFAVAAACGGSAAAPTPTAVQPTAPVAVPAPSPQRPALASPVASPSTASTSAAPTAAAAADTPGDSYEVQSGDTLGTIAEQFYGDSTLWRRIYDANKDAIGPDPDKLKLGMQLKIPPKQ